MNKFSLIFVVATQILVLKVMALESEAPLSPMERGVVLSYEKSDKIANKPIGEFIAPSSEEEEELKKEAEAPNFRRLGKHHSTDKSVAGGGVIIGGLVTATFAAVFCYIRVTRKRSSAH